MHTLRAVGVVGTVAFFISAASAATVAADSLLCETPEPFQTIASEGWTSKGGVAQIKTAKASAEGFRLGSKAAGVQRQLATREEMIRADSNLRLSAGSTAARAGAAAVDGSAADAKVAIYERIAATCSPSGTAPLEAAVIEQRPISGVSRVRVNFSGSSADLWVQRADLSDQ